MQRIDLVNYGRTHEILVELCLVLIKSLLRQQMIHDSTWNQFLFFFNSSEFFTLQRTLYRFSICPLNIEASDLLSLPFLIKWLSNIRNLAWVLFDFCHPPRLYELRVDALCIIEILDIDIGLGNASMMVHAHTLRIRILIIYHWDLNWKSGLLIQVEGIA